MQLVTGSKNYSSWTMRSWLVMRLFDIAFDEVKIALNRPETAADIARYSPSGRIPCLVLEDQVIWDSMAIGEYLAERFPHKPLWPRDARRRAHARSICAEMHAEFGALRGALHLDIGGRESAVGERALGVAAVAWEVRRVEQIWEQCLTQYGGPFLFCELSMADAYFAPMVLRFRTYALPVSSPAVAAYMDRIEHLMPVREWIEGAAMENQRQSVLRENRVAVGARDVS